MIKIDERKCLGPYLDKEMFYDIFIPYLQIGNIKYKWVGGFGSVLTSYERGDLVIGDTRVICGILFKVSIIRDSEEYLVPIFNYLRLNKSKEICWIPCIKFDAEWIRRFRKMLFNHTGQF